ncbi:MAG: phosphoesterase [Legionellales bacterium]|nr:phosphoesterase [Legionellales bacterium]|tara:strand:- start:11733 stop:12008 length:276 start_codon:yes stop_codon:yes gene_type:complete
MAVKVIQSHWRDSARVARLFIMDARAAFPLLLFLVHIRLWSFALALIATLAFAALEYFGFTVVIYGRMIRTYLAGKRKFARPWWREDNLRW